MKAYKIMLYFMEFSNTVIFRDIRYFKEKETANEVNLNLQNFLLESPHNFHTKQALREYIKLYDKKDNLTADEKVKQKTLELQLSEFIKFISTWPETNRRELLHFFACYKRSTEVVEFEIEE